MIRVDYAGPGGVCEGLRLIGAPDVVGIEWDAAACATRAAAGHLTIRADLATYRPHHRPGSVEGYWASPPCQTFSTAGKGDGCDQLDALAHAILAEDWAAADRFDPRTRHVIDAARTAVELGPVWIGMEQVPPVLPLWRALAHVLERHGYSTWAGVLCAADYGVPQTRRRAILMASRVRCVQPPSPTHAETPGLFGEASWVSMADALGWPEHWAVKEQRGSGMTERHGDRPEIPATCPTPTVTGSPRRRWILDRRQTGVPVLDVTAQPAPTLTGAAIGKGVWKLTVDGAVRRLTVAEALILQSFDPRYPVQGGNAAAHLQVGNAVPPLMAAHVAAALTGRRVPS